MGRGEDLEGKGDGPAEIAGRSWFYVQPFQFASGRLSEGSCLPSLLPFPS
jgi:hypothetical protein